MNLLDGFRDADPSEIDTPTQLAVEGEIPSDLRGVLFRNGPGQFGIHGERYRHLFDGDGLATRIDFREDGAYYTSRMVQSKHKTREDQAKRKLYGTYATRPPGGPLRRFLNRDFKNVGNTNLVYQWGSVFALYEGGPPHRLDPTTLDTMGEELFNNRLAEQQKFSAHPHRDPATDDVWNFGLTRKKETTITVYNMRQNGEFDVPFEIISPYSGIVHDFALTPNNLIFVVPPVKLPKVPLGLILGQRSYYESMSWHPDEPTVIIMVDRNTGREERLETESFMNFHVANAWEEDDALHIDLCNFDDFDVMKSMQEMISGIPPKRSVSYLERLSIEGRKVTRTRLSDTSMEFPRTVEGGFGTKRQYYFGTSWGDREWIAVPMRYDVQTQRSLLVPLEAHQYAGEPVPVPKSEGEDDSVWLLYTVLDLKQERSLVFIADGDNVTAPPVAQLTLPQRIPIPLHGNWVPVSKLS